MAVTVAETYRQVQAFLGRPDQARLPYRDVVKAIERKVQKLVADLSLADRNYRVEVVPLSPAGRDTVIPHSGTVVRLESRAPGGDEDSWSEWEEADYGDWNAVAGRAGRYYATYGYGINRHLILSSDPGGDEFRALVESGSVALSGITDEVPLEEVVRPLLFAEVAREVGTMVRDSSEEWRYMWAEKRNYLDSELPELRRQFRRHVEQRGSQGVTYREPFNEGRSVCDGPWVGSDGWLRSD